MGLYKIPEKSIILNNNQNIPNLFQLKDQNLVNENFSVFSVFGRINSSPDVTTENKLTHNQYSEARSVFYNNMELIKRKAFYAFSENGKTEKDYEEYTKRENDKIRNDRGNSELYFMPYNVPYIPTRMSNDIFIIKLNRKGDDRQNDANIMDITLFISLGVIPQIIDAISNINLDLSNIYQKLGPLVSGIYFGVKSLNLKNNIETVYDIFDQTKLLSDYLKQLEKFNPKYRYYCDIKGSVFLNKEDLELHFSAFAK